MSYRSRLSECSLVLLGSLFALSCGGGQAEAPPAATAPAPAPEAAPAPAAPAPAMSAAPAEPQAAAPAAAPAEPAAEHRHGHGMAAMFAAALAKVDLKPDQKATVDAALADIEKQGEGHGEAGKQLASDIADGAVAGKIDHKKTDADVKKLVAAIDATKAGMQDALNKIHGALDAAQRKKLVGEMKAQGEEMREHGMGEHGMGEHGMSEHGMGEHGMHEKGEHGDDEHEGKMKMLSEALGLSPEQVDKLKAKVQGIMKAQMATMKTNMEAMQKHMKAVGDAFETDKFDAKKAGVGEHASDMARNMTKNRIEFVEAVLTVLTPDQRAKFAEHIKSHAEGD